MKYESTNKNSDGRIRIMSRAKQETLRYSDAGFTLVEMLIYVGILAVIMSAAAYFVSWGIKMNTKIRVNQEVLENAKSAMEKIIFEIRNSQIVYTPTSVFDEYSSQRQLSLKTTLNIPAGENTTYADFYLENEKIYLKREGQNSQALTSEKVKVTNLIFRNLNSGSSIQIDLKVEYKTSSPKPEWQAATSLTSSASLRTY